MFRRFDYGKYRRANQKISNKKGYTQEKLGSIIGVTTQAVSKWERGSVPDAEMIPFIADALDVDINSLYGREEQDIQVFFYQKTEPASSARGFSTGI